MNKNNMKTDIVISNFIQKVDLNASYNITELKKILKEVYQLNIDNNNTKTVNKSIKLVHEMPLLLKK
tara:strand:+ start:355 stop:555 length:201 start_codon:yes stop_codon:yes gene_type:complete